MKKQNQYPVATEDLWQIIENLHDEIMVYDNDYHLVFVNKAAERHYGKTAEELIGTHFHNWMKLTGAIPHYLKYMKKRRWS